MMKTLKQIKWYLALRNSNLFDEKYYLTVYEDIRIQDIDPIWHYIRHGAKELRNPSKEFNTKFYLNKYDDIKNSSINPLAHYILYGVQENRIINLSGKNHRHASKINSFNMPFDLHVPINSITLPVAEDIQRVNKVNSIAIHIHCYYFDLLEELLINIKKIDLEKQIFISVSNSDDISLIYTLSEKLKVNLEKVVHVENRGRDIAPMLVEFSSSFKKCDIALHIHTKKSVEKKTFGMNWRKDLLKKLFFNKMYLNNVIALFENDEKLGLLYPSSYPKLKQFMNWGKNKQIATNLLNDMGIDAHLLDSKLEFPAGSMFFFRPVALEKLFNQQLKITDFPAEPISDDGTLAHAIERTFSIITKENGYKYNSIEPYKYEMSWPEFMKPIVSIIIPVYNSEKWIKNTLESLLKQDCSHVPFEIICVDNNSTDSSLEILKLYSKMYSHIKYFSESKQGAGDARNRGIENSNGKYIMFVDADDVLPIDAISNLYSAVYEDKTIDVVASSLVMFSENNEYTSAIPYGESNKSAKYIGSIKSKTLNEEWKKILLDFGPCAKLYKKSFLDEHNIRFPSNINFEDNAFIYDVYMNADNFAIVKKITYLYRRYDQHKGTTQSTNCSLDALKNQIEIIVGILKKYNINKEVDELIAISLFTKLSWEFERYGSDDIINILGLNQDIIKYLEKYNAWNKLGKFSKSIKSSLSYRGNKI